MRTTLYIQDPLIISAPNQGGLLYAHRHLLLPLLYEDVTGLATMADGLLWCVQSLGEPVLREIRHGQLNSFTLAPTPQDLHDVLVSDQGTYAVFTETNQVVQLDHAFRVIDSWCFGEQPDSAHVNGIAIHNGRLIASMFGSFTTHRGYKGKTRNAGRVVDVRSGAVLISGLSQPHSLVVVGEQLWLCSSEDRTIHVYDAEFRLERQASLPGYTRGLAVGGTAVYVGLSRSRNLAMSEAGEFDSAVVGVLDRRSLEVTGYLPIPWNEIYDIRIAASTDQVTDVMASTWVYERHQHQLAAAESAKHLDVTQAQLRAREDELQAMCDEVTRVTREASADISRMMEQVAATETACQAEAERAQALHAQCMAMSEQITVTKTARQAEAERAQALHAQCVAMSEQIAVTEAARQAEAERAQALHAQCMAMSEQITVTETARQAEAERAQALHAQSMVMSDQIAMTETARQAEAERAQALHAQCMAMSDQVAACQAATEAANKATSEQVEALQDLRIELRGEIVKREARIHLLEQSLAELELIKASRSWRWTKLLRFVTRTIHHRGLSAEDRRRLLRRLPAPVAAEVAEVPMATGAHAADIPAAVLGSMPVLFSGRQLAELKLAEPGANQRDFFLWAVIDWHFRIQRPQHLARELALAGHRVFYISNNFIDRREPGFSVETLDSEGRLFQIQLHLQGSPMIYHAAPDNAAQAQLRAGIGMLLAWTCSRACASLVQHPYWLETARILPNQRLVYDCMDHHGGFADNSEEVLVREHELMRDADLLVVTSDWLRDEAGKYNPQCAMIRNACQYEHFARRPAQAFKDVQGRRVIGYYGAIAEWFDLELIEKVARRFSDCLVLLVGADTTGAKARLQALGNVAFTGEVSYASLPYYLDAFDVCLLPFQVIPLTLATNPVKIYEYLSAGKEVVSIELPEIRQFGELVRTGRDHASFLDAVATALTATRDPLLMERRQLFAAEQTWTHRVQDLVQGIQALPEPRVSVVVVTYNNLDLTKACLHSLAQYSDYANLEVIVVDNASADGTPAYLREWVAGGNRQIVLNAENRGFAAGNNQGLALATGEYLVMLNNDTYVTPGWVATLVGHLRRTATLGMLGPVTNNIGNEARIEICYDNMDKMLSAAADYTHRHAGQLTPLRTAAFFCVMLRREVYEKVGPLDEAFGIGFFEDDDYCRRVEQAGWKIACADDVFIHHHLSASFNKLKQETRQALFEKNKAIYEEKWGAWVPHRYRETIT